MLGKGPPGGSWHRMDPNLRTLSLSAWMSLPGFDFNQWNELHPDESDINEFANPAESLQTISQQQSQANNNKNTNNKPSTGCQKCAELRPKQQQKSLALPSSNTIPANANNNNDNEICCRCTKSTIIATTTNHSQHPTDYNNHSDLAVNNIVKKVAFDIEVTLHKDTINNHLVPPKLPRRNLSVKRQMSKEVQTRALVSRVANYYENYVTEMGLAKNFINDTEVTSILPLHGRICGRYKAARWIVFAKSMHKSYVFVCRNLVLATGASDLANRLGLPEENNKPWIKHDLTQLEMALKNQTEQERSSKFTIFFFSRNSVQSWQWCGDSFCL